MASSIRWLVVLVVFGLIVVSTQGRRNLRATAPKEQSEPAIQKIELPKQRYWKGNLHTHSLWSDGNDFPEMIADWYKTHGYNFLALSDHNILAVGQKWVDADKAASGAIQTALPKYFARFGDDWVERRQSGNRSEVRLKPLSEFRSLLEEPGRFLLIPSEEITHRYARFPVHMNGTNLRDVIEPIGGEGVSETIRVNLRAVDEQRRRTGQPMVAHLNHPNYGWGVRAEDMAGVEELRFFEVFNGHPGVENYGNIDHASCERVWDIVLALRLGKLHLPALFAVATDDAHQYHDYGVGKVNPGRGWMMVHAAYLTPESIVQSMEAGDFYCSTGVVLNSIHRENNEVHLSIATAEGVKYRTEFIATLHDAPLDSEPRRDTKDAPVTGKYSDEIGKVVSTSDRTTCSYKFTGRELYVRAKVTSTKSHPNPYAAGDVEVAWTQPFLP